MSSSATSGKTDLGHGKKVVLFDRDKTMMLILKRLLHQQGFAVFMATGAQNGLDLIETCRPDLLVWELNRHPEVDFQMLHNARRRATQRPYVILISTPTTLNDDAPIEELHQGDVFMKPFEPADLIRRISWLVSHERI
jgi:DNA-binding response OmpR family regulator